MPRNTAPSQFRPLDRVPYDATGRPGPVESAATSRPMPRDLTPARLGMLEMPAGQAGRAGSVRYGAAGGGVAAVGSDLVRMSRGENVSGGEVLTNAATATAVGWGSARAFDALAPRLGGGMTGAVRAGGVVGGVLEGGMSLVNNAEAYRSGQETASQATANTRVDTSIGIGAARTGCLGRPPGAWSGGEPGSAGRSVHLAQPQLQWGLRIDSALAGKTESLAIG